jgi:hypothetical protein
MHLKSRFLLLLILIISFTSCKKEDTVTFATLTGKWKLSETYSVNANGAYSWQVPSPNSSKEIEFGSSGYYQEHTIKAGVLQICTGRFQLYGVNTVKYSTDCNRVLQTAILAVITENELRIDYVSTDASIIKERFVSIK